MRRLCTCFLLFAAAAHAQAPCNIAPGLSFPAAGAPPAVRAWTPPAPEGGTPAPSCTGWDAARYSTVVTVAARFRLASGAEGLRRRIGAVSATAGLLYWSASDRKWQPLILRAHAATGQSGASRPDFAAEEIAAGRTLFIEQEDNRFGTVVYRMRIRSASDSDLAFDVENAGVIRYLMLQLFQPGEVQAVYSLRKAGSDMWEYYAVARTSGQAGSLAGGREASAINRAVALYRHLAGIPSDQEPPAAR